MPSLKLDASLVTESNYIIHSILPTEIFVRVEIYDDDAWDRNFKLPPYSMIIYQVEIYL